MEKLELRTRAALVKYALQEWPLKEIENLNISNGGNPSIRMIDEKGCVDVSPK
jgi:hypothetical protein